MATELRWGLLSAGKIALTIARDFQIAGMKIQAVGARDLASANAFADKFNIPNRHDGYAALVADPEVDIVYVSTPQSMHMRDALLAIEAGKHVLLEKPFTINAKQASAIAEAAKRKGVFVMEAMWTRFLPTMDAVFEVIKSGKIGVPHYVHADHSQFLPITKVPRLWEPSLGGGALLDLGIYPISFAVRVLGIPDVINARGLVNDRGLDEITSMLFEYKNGSHAVLQTCMTMAGTVIGSIVGTLGRIELDKNFYEQTSFTVFDNDGKVVQRYEEKVQRRGMQYQGLHVEKCVREGLLSSPVMPLNESVEIMKVMDAIRAQTGVVFPGE